MGDTNRRSFVAAALPACAACCLALRCELDAAQESAKPDPQASPKHKFDLRMSRPLTYRQEMTLEYASHFIPFLRILETEIGHDKVVAILKKFCVREAEDSAKATVRARGKNDLTIFKEDYNPRTPQLTTEVLENTTQVWAIKITECLWAKVWIDAGAADLGVAAVCAGDSPFASFVNPEIRMDLEGTIMQGKPYCMLRYHYI